MCTHVYTCVHIYKLWDISSGTSDLYNSHLFKTELARPQFTALVELPCTLPILHQQEKYPPRNTHQTNDLVFWLGVGLAQKSRGPKIEVCGYQADTKPTGQVCLILRRGLAIKRFVGKRD